MVIYDHQPIVYFLQKNKDWFEKTYARKIGHEKIKQISFIKSLTRALSLETTAKVRDLDSMRWTLARQSANRLPAPWPWKHGSLLAMGKWAGYPLVMTNIAIEHGHCIST